VGPPCARHDVVERERVVFRVGSQQILQRASSASTRARTHRCCLPVAAARARCNGRPVSACPVSGRNVNERIHSIRPARYMVRGRTPPLIRAFSAAGARCHSSVASQTASRRAERAFDGSEQLPASRGRQEVVGVRFLAREELCVRRASTSSSRDRSIRPRARSAGALARPEALALIDRGGPHPACAPARTAQLGRAPREVARRQGRHPPAFPCSSRRQ
jgi:hypothetical protein